MINESLLTNGSGVAVGTVVVAGGTVVSSEVAVIKIIQQTKKIAIQVVIQILARVICEQ